MKLIEFQKKIFYLTQRCANYVTFSAAIAKTQTNDTNTKGRWKLVQQL